MTESGSETEKQDYVVTLEDKNSCHEVLKSKTKDDIKTNTSAVVLWIKSLKEDDRTPSLDDPTSDHPLHSGSGNDSDDLQLGADAATLHEKRRPYKHLPPLWLDSDSDSSHPRFHSWTGRQSLLLSRQSYDRSLDSDTSGLSSVTSVSSLLTARESDPEDVLRGLGFRTPGVLNKIPDRFIKTGTVCYGVDSQQFLADIKEDSDGSPHSNSEVPPWIMARIGDIPRKFWSDAEERHDTLPILSKIQSPVVESTTPDELKSESPSRCTKTYPPSKFGNYLEPVTEEVEGGSTSGSLSPLKSSSLESRSTLKFNSLEYPGSDLSQVPSLFDLWQTKEEVNEASDDDGTRAGIISMSSGEHSPRTPTTSYVPENIENGYSEDWIDRSRNTTVPQRRSTANENTCDHLRSERENPAVPSLSEYTNTGPVANVSISDSHIDNMESNVEIDREINSEKRVKYPLSLRIPTLTISEPTENARKLSSVEPPDPAKLLPVHMEEKPGKVSETSFDKSFSGNGHRCSTPIQLNLATSLSLGSRKHFQVQFACPAPKARRSRKFLSRNRKNRESKLSIMKPRHRGQLTLFDGESSQTISCFLDVKPQKNVVCSQDTGETVIEVFRNENETLTSLTGSYSENSVYYKDRKDSSLKCETIKTPEKCEFEDHKNNKYGLYDDNSECLRNDQTIEDRLDGLENNLRGVKMYKAGVHLMQLASSFETALHSRYDAKRSCDDLLSSIQQELKRLEDYMLRLQNELQGIQKKLKDSSGKKTNVEGRRGSDFSDITRQLLQEQLKIFSTISSAAATPSSTPSLSREPSICSDTPDVLRNTDVMKLRKEMQQLRQDSLGHNATLKDEILREVRSEIRECFKEYIMKNP